jgi:hypothetical protein
MTSQERFYSDALAPFEKVVFAPFTGEFGHYINYSIRRVYFHPAKEKLVCIKPGQEVLFPNCRYDYDWKVPTMFLQDEYVVGSGRSPIKYPNIEARYKDYKMLALGQLDMLEESYPPINPHERIKFYPKIRGEKVDVVIAPRKRLSRPEVNWTHWQELINNIKSQGLSVGVIGSKENSLHDIGEDLFSQDLDQSIEMLQTAKAFVGTDSGGSHLAACVGIPMIVFRHNSGRTCFIEHMKKVNNEFPFHFAPLWERQEVMNFVLGNLKKLKDN